MTHGREKSRPPVATEAANKGQATGSESVERRKGRGSTGGSTLHPDSRPRKCVGA